jgi:hypothetical protein
MWATIPATGCVLRRFILLFAMFGLAVAFERLWDICLQGHALAGRMCSRNPLADIDQQE